MTNSRICIGVLFGGKSKEHNVSIKSAATVIEALKRGNNSQRYSVAPFYIDVDGGWWPPSIAKDVLKERIQGELPIESRNSSVI